MSYKLLLRASKKKALEILAKNRLWLLMFLIAFLILCAFLGISYFGYALFNLFLAKREATLCAALLSFLVALFVLSPLWRGLQMLLLHGLIFGRTEISLLFYCYSHKKRYLRALRRCLGGIFFLVLCFFLLFAVALSGLRVGQYLLYAEREACALFILTLTFLFLLLIVFFFQALRDDAFLLDAVMLSAPLLSYRQCRATAARVISHKKETVRRFRRTFIPLWLLSFLLLGLPLVVVLPYYMGTKACLAFELIQHQD